MQIYDDRKRRIGVLSGFKNRAVATTLDSGDKELSFEYPANGILVDLLKEEYYIRTQTDEFVIKATEKGEQWNKYTAILNVEELEGTQFPYGFASNEQTIRACLEFAFDGTGWTVGTCTVTKKRTIDEEENVSAWDILQKCLSTYRCECVIDSLNKQIDIYETIGSDKGCYFMEGLNLRKLTPKSDTYEFYTRIYPIGKDGITPGWILRKDYIDNFQYSKKVKAYVWKDERYTNTTSLIEDATAKLEGLSRPYVAFTATVADLAKANTEHKDILSYSIGDTVSLVSRTTRTKEKQRIVKIVEYPESPEKNTVELSNARKSFAQIQQEETETAKEEAISISNRTMKKVLENYSTSEEIETKITASKEEVELGVMHTLESYYDKTETDALIGISKGEIELGVSQTYQTKEGMNDYSTTEETKSLIDMAADSVELSVGKTLEKYPTSEEVDAEFSEARASIKLNADGIAQKVSKGEVSSEISQEAGAVSVRSNRLTVQSDNFSLTQAGEVTATGEFKTRYDALSLMSVQRGSGLRILQYETDELGRIESGSAGSVRGLGIGAPKVMIFHNGSNIGYIYNPNSLITQYADYRHVFAGHSHFLGNLSVGGTKNRAVKTENYGTVAMNAVESASPFFADMGSGRIDGDGKCYLVFDSIFRETIDTLHEYYVFVSGTSGSECRCIKKGDEYAVIEGEPGAAFDWVVYGKQKGYAMTRMETLNIPDDAVLDSEDLTYNESDEENLEVLARNYLDEYERELMTT